MHWSKDPVKKQQVIDKIKEKNSGENHPNFGKHLDQSTKEKIASSQKGVSAPQRGRPGHGTSEEARQNMRIAREKQGPKKRSEIAQKTHTPEADAKRRQSFQQHNELIRQYAKKYTDEGYEVITEQEIRPDLIIRKGCIIIAVEIQRKAIKNNYDGQKVFDDVFWIPIKSP